MHKAVTGLKVVNLNYGWNSLQSSLIVEFGLVQESEIEGEPGKVIGQLSDKVSASLQLGHNPEVQEALQNLVLVIEEEAHKQMFEEEEPA